MFTEWRCYAIVNTNNDNNVYNNNKTDIRRLQLIRLKKIICVFADFIIFLFCYGAFIAPKTSDRFPCKRIIIEKNKNLSPAHGKTPKNYMGTSLITKCPKVTKKQKIKFKIFFIFLLHLFILITCLARRCPNHFALILSIRLFVC